ncbi:N-terminal Xaa-Pro-Lys N-methyltransferase 1-B-like [Actinia tenebrosa]|uniref:Alpha N-terminal protein methyltransferase 1 n=1 Tax=Actinia tenebrosa TaxID=6105 RepID=A0A6P8IY45_ACTTE|nr:N-terminal Xaa-Pro-Lys N-methyltransferase 1-B-like [Actinia tenebrosa]XP_031572381.1 N-terminal Xaa-Pro-Lys N-methyltransferase 1-B-like [Actinia tenebrosa]
MEKNDDEVTKSMPEEMKNKNKWYGDAIDYWKEIPATDNGMLGGFAHISSADIDGSKKFLKQFLEPQVKKQKTESDQPRTQSRVALDCGAGIGRVTKQLLIPLFDKVDMLEQNKDFLDHCDEYMGDLRSKIENLYPIGLQEFDPEPGRYDVIWCQWVMGHLTDDDFIEFLNRCKKGLAEGGIVCIKENIVTRQDYDIDAVDSSVTRSHQHFAKLFERANMTVLKRETQSNFPKEIYKVNMYALVANDTQE